MSLTLTLVAMLGLGNLHGVLPQKIEDIITHEHRENARKWEARITFYHRFQDRYGSRVAMDGVGRAKEGITVAADPSIPFGAKVFIPELEGVIGEGEFVVQDRGTAVTRRKASKGKALVFDIYIEAKTPKEANKRLKFLQHTQDDYMTVYVVI